MTHSQPVEKPRRGAKPAAVGTKEDPAAAVHSRSMPEPPAARRQRRAATRSKPLVKAGFPIRVLLFLSLALMAIGGGYLVWPRTSTGTTQAGPADVSVSVTMDGFSQKTIRARAGQPLRVKLVNPDSSFHTDGGGWHQLAVPDLGVDAKIAPRSQSVIEIPAAQPGEYAFYCDVCCGGKENPAMQGTIQVQA